MSAPYVTVKLIGRLLDWREVGVGEESEPKVGVGLAVGNGCSVIVPLFGGISFWEAITLQPMIAAITNKANKTNTGEKPDLVFCITL